MSYFDIGIACAASAVIAAWMLANSRYSAFLRAFCGVIIICVALVTWHDLGALFGYPVAAIPPNDSMLESSIVQLDNHAIYLWVVPPSERRPRAFVVPYSLQFARELKKAEDAMRHGNIVRLQTGVGHKGVHGTGEPNGGLGHPGGIESSRQPPNITITVRPLLPDKN